MAKNIDPELKKIGNYLKLEDDAIFVIPEYQRAYSWGIAHCDKLWQDICDYIDSDSKDRYFFGTIIVNCQANDTEYVLIDGQQRTTTFLLLLKAMLMRVNDAILRTSKDEDSTSLCNGLKERRRKIMGVLYRAETEDISDMPNKEKDAEIYKGISVLENKSINERYQGELTSILEAADYPEAESRVIKIKYKQKDNRYTNFFRNFKFFYYKCVELSDSELNTMAKAILESCEVIEIRSWQVEQAIKMFNSLNSDGLPLYDSDIISAQLYAEAGKTGQEKEFSELWKQLNEQLVDLEGIKIDINSVLMQHMYFVRTINRETISDSGSINVTTPGLRRYFTEINTAVLRNPVAMCTDMLNLVKIWKSVSDYPLMKVLLKFNENSKLFLASYFYRFEPSEVSEAAVNAVLECMLRLFAMLELSDFGYSSKYFKTFLFAEEAKLADKSIGIDTIRADFNTHIAAYWKRDAVKEMIQDYDGNLLVYLNEYLFARETGSELAFGAKYDIEHIMPHSGNNLQEIRKDAGIESEEEFAGIVNKLGNKILLEERINRAIGNEWFRTKVSTTLESKTGYIDSKFPIAQALVDSYRGKEKPYWTKEDIAAATEEASERIVRFIFGEIAE